MPIKDVYGKKVSEQNHMILAHSPTSMLIEELKRRKMSDGREFLRDMWKQNTTNDSINNPELYTKTNPKNIEYNTHIMYMPDQYKHKIVSFLKSGVRILGYGACWWSLDVGLILLILAEIIGIKEELV